MKNNLLFKTITIIIISALILVDIAWAGPIQKADCLSPTLNITKPIVIDSFDMLFKKEINDLMENDLFVGTLTQLELAEELERIFKKMGIDTKYDGLSKSFLDKHKDLNKKFQTNVWATIGALALAFAGNIEELIYNHPYLSIAGGIILVTIAVVAIVKILRNNKEIFKNYQIAEKKPAKITRASQKPEQEEKKKVESVYLQRRISQKELEKVSESNLLERGVSLERVQEYNLKTRGRKISRVSESSQYRSWLSNWIDTTFRKGKSDFSVLSLGSGKGNLELVLQQKGHQVLAIELSSFLVEESKTKGLQAIQGNAKNPGNYLREEQKFDLIIFSESIGSLGLKTIEKAEQLLKPGGSILICDYPFRVNEAEYISTRFPTQRIPSEKIAEKLKSINLADIRVLETEKFSDDDRSFRDHMVLIYGTKLLVQKLKKDIKLKTNSLATVLALGLTFADKIENFIYAKHRLITSIGFGVGSITLAYLFYRFLKSEKFNRMISPLHTKWYIWRLELDQKNPVDSVIIGMISNTQKRKQLINQIKDAIAHLKDDERKQIRTPNQQAIDELLAEKLKKILFFRLEKMGTDSYYPKALYRFYSKHFRVRKFKIELGLNPIDEPLDREFLSYVAQGWNEETILKEYLEPNLKSAIKSRRRYARRMLEKFVQAGMLSRDEFIQMSMDILKSGSAEAAKDILLGLEEYVHGLDEHLREKMLMHLKINLESHNKKIKQAQAKAKKSKEYFEEELKVRKNEGKRIENLLNSVARMIFEDMVKQEDILTKLNLALSLENVLIDINENLLKGLKQALVTISVKYRYEIEKATEEFRRESMGAYIIGVMKGMNTNHEEKERAKSYRALSDVLKANKRETDRLIKTIEKILNKKDKENNNNSDSKINNGLLSVLERIKQIAPIIKSLSPFNNKVPSFVGQAI